MVNIWQRLDQAGRNLAPGAVTVMLALVGMIPLYLPGWERITPGLALMGVYYWAIHRPDLLRPSTAFAIGLLQDLLSGEIPGLHSLTYVVTHGIVMSQRSFFLASSFLLLWWGFALIVFGAAAVHWASYCLLTWHLLPVDAVLVQAALTLTLFPPFAWLFIRVHRAFLVNPSR